MKREWKLFVQDIYDAIRYIKEFVGDMNRKEFLADEKTRSAVAFKIENIGEASKNIPKVIRAKYKDLPWTDMATSGWKKAQDRRPCSSLRISMSIRRSGAWISRQTGAATARP